MPWVSCCFVLFGLASAATLHAAELVVDQKRPNVLVFLTDQHNHRILSCAGSDLVHTPNIDRLAAEGTFFENACASYPICSPSRISLATGTWAHAHRVERNTRAVETDPARGLGPDAMITEAILHAAGWRTFWHGKFHMGDVRRHPCFAWHARIQNNYVAHPAAVEQFNRSHPPDAPPGQDLVDGWPIYVVPALRGPLEQMRGKHKHWTSALVGRKALPVEMEEAWWLADHTIRDIEEFGDEPFMMTLSMEPPHPPNRVQDPWYSMVDPAKIELPTNLSRPDGYEDRFGVWYSDLIGPEGLREYLRVYYAQVLLVDHLVGRVLAALERAGQLDNTLIIFTSDHGDMNGAHGCTGKVDEYIYDELMRVPLIMRLPGAIPKGHRVRTFCNGVDLLPTILDYCGVEIPAHVQGRSLRANIEGEEDMTQPAFFEFTNCEAGSAGRVIRTHDWKYCIRLRSRQGKPLWTEQLYNMKVDPGEERDLGADPNYGPVRKQLRERLTDWMRVTDDHLRARVPESF